MTAKKEKCNISNSNSSSSSIQLFYYEGLSVRTIYIDGEIWFVAKDVADILGYDHTPHATRFLDDDEKDVLKMDTLGGEQEMSIISEPGLYELVFRSHKPDAKAFSRWVRHDVLPSIRKTGSYSLESNTCDNETIRQIIKEQHTLNQRIRFWKSLYDAAQPLFNILLNDSQGFYIVPCEISYNKTDNSEINLLRGLLKQAKEFISDKISSLERKENLIKKIIDD